MCVCIKSCNYTYHWRAAFTCSICVLMVIKAYWTSGIFYPNCISVCSHSSHIPIILTHDFFLEPSKKKWLLYCMGFMQMTHICPSITIFNHKNVLTKLFTKYTELTVNADMFEHTSIGLVVVQKCILYKCYIKQKQRHDHILECPFNGVYYINEFNVSTINVITTLNISFCHIFPIVHVLHILTTDSFTSWK